MFFKHSNLNSFIRQLNMYGFRKVTNLEQGALKHQSTDLDSLEFHHQYFIRGHPEMLQNIRRKTTGVSRGTTATAAAGTSSALATSGGGAAAGQQQLVNASTSDSANSKRLNQALDEIRQLREKQMGMDARLGQVKRENEGLWREMAHMRQMHVKQQQVVTKLIQFLLTFVQPTSGGRLGKRNLLAIGANMLNQGLDLPSKRIRLDSGDAVEIIESLEQELRNRNQPVEQPRVRNAYSHSQSSAISGGGGDNGNNDGPTIADITEESEHELGSRHAADTAITGVISPADFGETSPIGHGDFGTASAISPQAPSNVIIEQPESDMLTNFVPQTPDNNAYFQQQQQQPSNSIGQQQPLSAIDLADMIAFTTAATGTVTSPQATSYSSRTLLSPPGNFHGSEAHWSKPDGEFSQYLDYVQTDLDSLKDFLSSEGLDLDNNSLNDLFTVPDQPLDTNSNFPNTSSGGSILGNELQLYKAPEPLVNLDLGNANPSSGPSTSASAISSNNRPIPLSGGGFDAMQSDTSPIFASPPAHDQQQTMFDQLDTPLFAPDPMLGMVSTTSAPPLMASLSTPIMSPSSSSDQLRRIDQLAGPGPKVPFGNGSGARTEGYSKPNAAKRN